jgi:hypothetical protein
VAAGRAALVAHSDEVARAALARYVETLPIGLESYPECQVKGSVLRGLSASSPVPFPRAILPPPLLALLDDPPLPSDWIPEVPFLALMVAHESQPSPSAHTQWAYERNRRLLRSPLYSVLFRVAGPARVFTGMTTRWQAFRRGTEVVMHEQTAGRAVVELRYPGNLYPAGALVNVCCAVRAVLDAAGAASSTARVLSFEATRATLEASWT